MLFRSEKKHGFTRHRRERLTGANASATGLQPASSQPWWNIRGRGKKVNDVDLLGLGLPVRTQCSCDCGDSLTQTFRIGEIAIGDGAIAGLKAAFKPRCEIGGGVQSLPGGVIAHRSGVGKVESAGARIKPPLSRGARGKPLAGHRPCVV